MRILNGVRHFRSFEINLQDKALQLYFFFKVESIKSDLELRYFSCFFNFFNIRLSFFETCLCDLQYFSWIDLSQVLTCSIDFPNASFSSSRDLDPLIKRIGREAIPQELYNSFTNPPIVIISVIINLKNVSPYWSLSNIYCCHYSKICFELL